MGSDYIPFALGPPLFGAFYTIPFELRMLILGVVIFVAIIWWVSKQGRATVEKGESMPNELVRVSGTGVPATVASAALPMLVERAWAADRFARDEFFYTEDQKDRPEDTHRARDRKDRGCGTAHAMMTISTIGPGNSSEFANHCFIGRSIRQLLGSAATHKALLCVSFHRVVRS